MTGRGIIRYSFPTDIVFGNGASKELPKYLLSNKLNAPLVVTDPNVSELRFFKDILNQLKNAGLKPEVFSDMHKNPVKSDVLKGGEAFEKNNSDCVIGIGGGAAMDVARAIVLRIHNRRDLFDYDDLIGGAKYVTEKVPHFVTVPTTAGTGSEVGRSAIVSENESKKKRILFHPTLLAKTVFADPELTYELPPSITAATGMDALTHNMEAYLAKGFNPMCDGIALEGIRLISSSLEKAVNSPTPEARSNMLIGSLMGAVAFQKGLGVVHSMAHPLSSLLDMHHGLANAICIPYGMEYNISGQEMQFSKISEAMDLENREPESVINALNNLNSSIGIPSKLSTQGVSNDHIEQLSKLAEEDFCHPSNPIPVTRNDFTNLYKTAL